jgi:valyl-tRNA synthetase
MDVWEKNGLFSPNAADSLAGAAHYKKPYVIMMPPPNVTGVLHNGHALFVTLEDILVRFHRMLGENVLWQPGLDHAGIATQAVVERELKRNENKTRHELGREEFLARVWDYKEKNGDRIIEQMKTLGASADFSRLRFTMDEQCTRAVKEAFVRLWNDGLIFRAERLVNWDPGTQTALSDEEIEHIERETELWSFAYKVKDEPGEEIVVATTRPETMLGDTAVAVHPNDARYKHLLGKRLVHPFFPERDIRVIADDFVDLEFGTGAVKITPAHDFNDFAMAERQDLARINIFHFDMTVNEHGAQFAGLDRNVAREKVKEELTARGLFRGTKKLEHSVAVSQRSGDIIEPMLSRQYFVRAAPLAKKAYDAVASGETRLIPESWRKTWDHFMLNIKDWCISRQLWWGHRIPVFYDLGLLKSAIAQRPQSRSFRMLEEGAVLAAVLQTALNELDDELVRSFCVASTEDLTALHPGKYVQEEDVLDTWFSSGLWPFATLGWPDNTDDLKAFYPGAVLETGFDILFFWVARMMMLGVHFMGKAPFADVYLHAMVRDAHGRKMSKSLGNAIDPLDVVNGITLSDLLEKTKTYPVPAKMLPQVLDGLKKDYADGIPAAGADGLRLSLAMLSGQGRDVKLSIPRVVGYRSFLNKVWNATRFALMRIGAEPVRPLADVQEHLGLEDKWILSRLERALQTVRDALHDYKFSVASDALYQFFWTEFCDWYIEFAKLRLAEDADKGSREAARSTLLHVLDASMRMMHPFCPFVSEEIWQILPTRQSLWEKQGVQFCAVAPFPVARPDLIDEASESQLALIQAAIVAIRNARQESGLPAQKRLPAILLAGDESTKELLARFSHAIVRLALLERLDVDTRSGFALPPACVVNASAAFDAVLLLAGAIDVDAERARLGKELQKLQAEQASLKARLENKAFLEKAPVELVATLRERIVEIDGRVARVSQLMATL